MSGDSRAVVHQGKVPNTGYQVWNWDKLRQGWFPGLFPFDTITWKQNYYSTNIYDVYPACFLRSFSVSWCDLNTCLAVIDRHVLCCLHFKNIFNIANFLQWRPKRTNFNWFYGTLQDISFQLQELATTPDKVVSRTNTLWCMRLRTGKTEYTASRHNQQHVPPFDWLRSSASELQWD